MSAENDVAFEMAARGEVRSDADDAKRNSHRRSR